MFISHFQNNFSPCALADGVVVSRDASYSVVPYKVSFGDRNRLDKSFSKEDLFASMSSMQNFKCLGMDGIHCYKAMWDTIGDYFSSLTFDLSICSLSLIKLCPKL
jgi:hypothetical protein